MNPKQTIVSGPTFSSLMLRFMAGALIGLGLISLFVFVPDNIDPSWPANWRVRPLILTPLIAGTGTSLTVYLDGVRKEGGWKTIIAFLISLLIFLCSLWAGMILGLVGTMWD